MMDEFEEFYTLYKTLKKFFLFPVLVIQPISGARFVPCICKYTS